jgi:hypothetical protein
MELTSMEIDRANHKIDLKGLEDIYVTLSEGPRFETCGRHCKTKAELRRRCRLCMMSAEPRGSSAWAREAGCGFASLFLLHTHTLV